PKFATACALPYPLGLATLRRVLMGIFGLGLRPHPPLTKRWIVQSLPNEELAVKNAVPFRRPTASKLGLNMRPNRKKPQRQSASARSKQTARIVIAPDKRNFSRVARVERIPRKLPLSIAR